MRITNCNLKYVEPSCLKWLIDSGLVYKQKLVEKPEIPLSYMADDSSFSLVACFVSETEKNVQQKQ